MKVSLDIPESLNDITLRQYQEFIKIEEPTQDDYLRIFLNLEAQGVNQIKASEIDRLVNYLNLLFEQKPQHSLQFTLNGSKFGFIPKIDEITYGENKDITSYINDWKNMHKAMAVMYRPIKQKQGNKYLITEYNGTSEWADFMLDMPLGIVMGAMVFFWNLTNELLKSIPNYLEKQTKIEQMKGQISAESGEAIKNLIPSLKVMLEDMTKLLSLPYTLA